MSMTRKHYREAAEEINIILNYTSEPVAKAAVADVARSLAAMFKRDNSNFRYDTFYEACGLDLWGNVKAEESEA